MTATSRPRRTSKDVQSHLLGTALRGLGLALGTSATPRREFERDLRERLIEEARLIALRPKAPPRSRRPRRRGPSSGGGIRLAAIGIGFSLAGGGMVAAAHSLSLPARSAVPANNAPPDAAVGSSAAPSRAVRPAAGPPPPGELVPGQVAATPAARPAPTLTPAVPPAVTTPVAALKAPAVTAIASTPARPTATAAPTFQPPQILITVSPQIGSTYHPAPSATLVPTWLFPQPSPSPTP